MAVVYIVTEKNKNIRMIFSNKKAADEYLEKNNDSNASIQYWDVYDSLAESELDIRCFC